MPFKFATIDIPLLRDFLYSGRSLLIFIVQQHQPTRGLPASRCHFTCQMQFRLMPYYRTPFETISTPLIEARPTLSKPRFLYREAQEIGTYFALHFTALSISQQAKSELFDEIISAVPIRASNVFALLIVHDAPASVYFSVIYIA